MPISCLPGNLLWAGRVEDAGPPLWRGKGGLLREYTWDGEVVWEHSDPAQHHDFRRRPDGSTIYIGWEPVPADVQPRIKGGQPGSEHEGVTYSDYVREVSPTGDTVWEWHAWRDLDLDRWELCHSCGRDEFAHANACFPLDDGGVMLSFRRLNAIMMIDRETCKTRWSHQDATWGHQHDCTVLPNGNILLFANGIHGLDNPFSRVIELDPKSGETVWHYRGSPIWTFFSPNISGAQRFDNGNTLICEGQMGRAFGSLRRARSSGSTSARSLRTIRAAVRPTACSGSTATRRTRRRSRPFGEPGRVVAAKVLIGPRGHEVDVTSFASARVL